MNDTTPIVTNDSRKNSTITYILRNSKDKYYCGKTNNMERRLKEHSIDKWKNYNLIWYICGDHEKKIKIFGVKNSRDKSLPILKRFYNCITIGVVS